MGKKTNPSLVKICDIKDTAYDPIAKSLRKYIKDEKIKGKIPAVAGIMAANYCIDKIINT